MMKQITKRLLIVASLATLPAILPAHPLWYQAVESLRMSEGLLPGAMAARFDQYNGRGELTSSDETVVKLWADENGEVQSRVVSAKRNGEDVTDERRDNPQSSGAPFGAGQGDADDDGSPFAGLQRNPFAPEEQLHVTIVGAGGRRVLAGVIVLPIEFEHRTGPDAVIRGTAWLDVSTGDPVQLETTVDPLPRFVSELVMVQHFARNQDGQLVVERVEFSGEGRILLFRRRLESVLFFSEYFRLP